MNFSKLKLTTLGLNFVFLASNGLNPEDIKRTLYWVSDKAVDSEPSSVTEDGKYKRKSFSPEAINALREGNELPQAKGFSLEQARRLQEKLSPNSFFNQDKNVELVDISYESLKGYYDRTYRNTERPVKFTACANSGDEEYLGKIQEFFNHHENDEKKLNELIEEFFCMEGDPEKAPAYFKVIMDRVLNTIKNSETGRKRIRGLLLAALISHTDGDVLHLEPYRVKVNIAYLKGQFGHGATYLIDPLAVPRRGFGVDTVGNRTYSNLEDFERSKRMVKLIESAGNGNKMTKGDNELFDTACNLITVAFLHEMSHHYQHQFRVGYMSADQTFAPCLKNPTLANVLIPLSDYNLRNRVKEIAKQDDDIKEFIKENKEIIEDHINAIKSTGSIDEIDVLIDREIARELNSLDGAIETLAINGYVPAYLGNNKFILIRDEINENAMRSELKEPIRYGHFGYRLNDKMDDSKPIYTYNNEVQVKANGDKVEFCKLNYKPFPINPQITNGYERMFEPIILQKIIGKAWREI